MSHEKKRSEETQTLRACCSKAEPKNFAPPQTPFPGAQDGTQFGEDRCMQFRVIVVTDPQTNTPTNTQTHKPTERTDYNTLRRRFASAQYRYALYIQNACC